MKKGSGEKPPPKETSTDWGDACHEELCLDASTHIKMGHGGAHLPSQSWRRWRNLASPQAPGYVRDPFSKIKVESVKYKGNFNSPNSKRQFKDPEMGSTWTLSRFLAVR